MTTVPAVIAPALKNLAIVVENAPPAADPDMYARYEAHGRSDAQIVIFMRPLVEDCADDDELRQEIQRTVVHEIGHHLGMDDAHLDRLSFG